MYILNGHEVNIYWQETINNLCNKAEKYDTGY